MKIMPALIPIAITISVLLVACAAPAQPESKASVEVSCDEFNDNHHINRTLEVQSGEIFEVRLCSSPTVGFRWLEEAQIDNAAVLKQEEHKCIGPDSEPPPPPGIAWEEVWTFRALKHGSSTIYLELSEPWVGGKQGGWTCTVTVTVK